MDDDIVYVTLMEFRVVKYRVPREEVEHLTEMQAWERNYDYHHEVLNDGDLWIDERKE